MLKTLKLIEIYHQGYSWLFICFHALKLKLECKLVLIDILLHIQTLLRTHINLNLILIKQNQINLVFNSRGATGLFVRLSGCCTRRLEQTGWLETNQTLKFITNVVEH